MIESIHNLLRKDYGKDCLILTRNLEKTARKIASFRNHLRFTLRCLQSELTPRSVRLSSNIKGPRADKIIRGTERKLLNERVRQINFTINNLNKKKEAISRDLNDQLPREIYNRVIEFTEHAQLAQHDITKTRQVAKFDRLESKASAASRADKDTNWRCKDNNSGPNVKERWVKNLSDRSISDSERSLLEKGLNYAVSSKRIEGRQVTEIITSTESAIRSSKLEYSRAEELRQRVNASILSAKPPKSNLTKSEYLALDSLKKDDSITILPADKGRCTVVLNSKDYDQKVKTLLEDTKTYTPLKRDPTGPCKSKVTAKLKELHEDGAIDVKLKLQLNPTAETIPTFYGLPKVHKANVPLRPIVSSIGAVTYDIAKFLAKILGPLVGKSEHHILNSKDFADKISDLSLEPDETITSFDVTALFTSIPPVDAVKAIREVLRQDTSLHERTDLSPDQLCDLLQLCLDNTYFSYGGQFYKQSHGCSMGSPISPIISNLYMENFERVALSTFNGIGPSKWYRYVDDTWVLIKACELDRFFNHINQVDPNIKFTQEGLSDNKLAFLDCLVHVEEDLSLSVSVYRKQTHTDQYLQFDSNHPLIQKLGVVKTLFHRAETIVTKESEKKAEQDHLRKALHHCGFKNWAIDKALNSGGKRR
ncbi:uncharacterized protein [Amphiura filiformis]|uniref:uncharacterized protein n=1 Tax=Amphiura filiformis TaxID=82378 RepID=UPI003B2256C1